MTVPKDFECPICFNILYKPVTTSCGHNFCKFCIDQAIHSSPNCPLCRIPLSSQYSPNLLLTQLINERFKDEIQSRHPSKISFNEVQNSMQNSPDYNPDLSYLPLYYRNFYQPPIFVQENATIKISNISMYRMLQYAYSNNSLFITTRRYFKKRPEYGTIVRIKSNNIYEGVSQIPIFPIFVDVVGLHRVRLNPTLCKTEMNFEIASYEIFNDISYLPKKSETEPSLDENLETESEPLKIITDIKEAVKTKSRSYELLLEDFQKVKNLDNLNHHEKLRFCYMLLLISMKIVKRQMKNIPRSLQINSRDEFGIDNIVMDDRNYESMEFRSLLISKVLLASNRKKWEWFSTDDTLERLMSITEFILYSRDKNIIDPEQSQSSFSFIYSMDPLISGLIFLVILILAGWLYRSISHRR